MREQKAIAFFLGGGRTENAIWKRKARKSEEWKRRVKKERIYRREK